MTDPQHNRPPSVAVGEAKGRPFLTWVGKRPLRHVPALPAQEVERFRLDSPAASAEGWGDWPDTYSRNGLLFHGENKEVLAHLLASGFRGVVDLIYIDPPFDSGANYVRRVELRGPGRMAPIDGEGYSLGEQIQYTDIWANDNYLQFMFERLLLLREMLKPDANIVIHTDYHRTHQLRMLMDEVFGADHFVNELVWHYPDNFQGNVKGFASNHDLLLWYGLGDFPWNRPARELEETVRRPTRVWDSGTNRLVLQRDAEGRPIYRDYTEARFDDVLVIPQRSVVVPGAADYTGYPTAKPPTLISLLVSSLSPARGIVLDAFVGSGTTALVAQRLGRRWIGCDINKGSVQTTSKRLIDEMRTQAEASSARQTTVDGSGPPEPAQLSFATYRVNDYDLAIQHNEAVELACRALGIERLKTDGFFDGTLGRQLVRILPFDHPASPLDVEEVIGELRNRPTEERDVVIVALGKELACEARLVEHNRPGAPNRITLIELRTDPKLAGFFAHEPASAEVRLEEADGRVQVVIEDFVSPTILERLRQQDGLVSPQITDWRAMVDSVMIDADYDGTVFEIGLADVPERKSELVAGSYALTSDAVGDTIAVKIVDMLGEEVLAILSREPPK